MPAFTRWDFPVFEIFLLRGHQIVEHNGIGGNRSGLRQFFKILKGFVGDKFPLFKGDIHPVQELYLVFFFKTLDVVNGGINGTAGSTNVRLVQTDDDKSFVPDFEACMQMAAMGGPFL